LKDCYQMEFSFLGQSAEDSHAKTSATQGKEKESLGRDPVSGRRCFDSSEMYGQRGQLLKMYRPFDLRGLPWSFKISARSGIAVNGIAYPLVPLARLTRGTASGSQLIATPTATANQLCPSMMKHPGCRNMWPTPTATERSGINTKTGTGGGLTHAAKTAEGVKMKASQLWPTPCNNPRPNEGNVRILRAKVISGELTREEAAGMLLGKDPFESQGVVPVHYSEESVKPITGSLNPAWVEWLMGFPAGWTDLDNSETP
jgi:hypothetical protein